MYSEGEERYLKDLDCVNIVKSIRELKALTRIIMDQHQRQILAFERESVIPSSKFLEEQEINQIQNKVPFEYSDQLKHQEYYEEMEKFIGNFTNKNLSNLDCSIINELADETTKSYSDINVTNSSNLGSMITDPNPNKWD